MTEVHLMQRERDREKAMGEARSLVFNWKGGGGRGSGTVLVRVVGWVALFFVLSALLIIWAYKNSDRSWFQKPHTLQFSGRSGSGLLNNVSIYLGKSAMQAGSATKNDSHNASMGGRETEAVLPANASMAGRETEVVLPANASMAGRETEVVLPANASMAGRETEAVLPANASMAGRETEVVVPANASMGGRETEAVLPVNASMGGRETEAVLPANASIATRGYDGRPEASVSSAIEEAERSAPQQGGAQCNLFRGKWVYEESYVLYPPGSCPYASIDFDCRKNGRMDSYYERWRWQPHDCDLPRFNASHMLEILRGKRLVYVGDSINRNQWESMLCLMRTIVPRDGGFLHVTDGGKFIQYVVKAYNCSIELSWAPFLVRQQRRYSTNGSAEVKETLSLDTIAEQSEQWKHADVLVFNTGHWWSHDEPYNGVDYFEEGGHVIPYMKGLAAFDKALKTWANWVDTHINPQKTKVFFRGYSPVHFHGKAWGKKVGGGCFNETEPIREMGEDNEQIYGERKRIQTVQKVVGQTKIGVQLLDITGLSMYRKDAHASVYTSKYSTMLNKNDYSYADCSHWCLPGLPDVWNNLLYALLT